MNTRKAAARERLEQNLESIKGWNPHVNAMMAIDEARARREADALDTAAAEGRWPGLLYGMTVTVKDNIDTAGLTTTSGSLFFKDRVPDRDATVVTRLRRAGALVVGKVTLHEFAFGIRSYNPVIGQCRNPYDRARIPGGSSGGSGVAVATGMSDGSLGSDTGGSVRLPASLNGVAGLRPTLGRVSNHGSTPVSPSHDTIGPMARSVADVARLFAVLAGYDPLDPLSEHEPLENFLPALDDGVAGVRIGLPRRHFFENLDRDIASAVEQAIAVFEKLGATLSDIDLPGAELAHHHTTVMIFCDACHFHRERLQAPATQWGAMTLERLRMGLEFTGRDYAAAQRARESWKRTLADAFQTVDILLTPTTPVATPLIDDAQTLFAVTKQATNNTYAGGLGAIPGLSIPCGVSRDGMPIGLQLEGAWWREPLLLRAGQAYQRVTDWHRRRPELPPPAPTKPGQSGP